MLFYPYILKRQWYVEDVCRHIYASLEGAKNWTKYYYKSNIERQVYLETFEVCQTIVKRYTSPTDMLQALNDYHYSLRSSKVHSSFLICWLFELTKVRDQAIHVVIQLVDGLNKKYIS